MKLVKKITNSLIGITLLGAVVGVSEANAQTITKENQNIVRIGAENDSSKWSYGPKVDRSRIYLELGRGLTDKVTIFGKVSGENPVINEGFEANSLTTDVSPNHFIFGAGIGLRSRLYENGRWSINGELEANRLSEFDEHVFWANDQRTEIHVNGITDFYGKLWAERNIGNFNFRFGGRFGSSFASGTALTHHTNPDNIDTKYSEFNQRNKSVVSGEVGLDYLGDNYKFMTTGRFGANQLGINIGIERSW